MGKLSSYQKLKAENAQLKKDIYLLVEKPNSLEGMSVKNRYSFQNDISQLSTFGSRESKGEGLVLKINSHELD